LKSLTNGNLRGSWDALRTRFGANAEVRLSRRTRARSAAAMRLHTYRDEAHSRHFHLIGGGCQPWSIDLVAISAAGMLVLGFAGVVVAMWVQ
jgi:hypothetical protein